MDIVGPIEPPSNQKNHILVFIHYLTKWKEVKSLKIANEKAVENFLIQRIFSRYGVAREIVTDQGTQFTSRMIGELMRTN